MAELFRKEAVLAQLDPEMRGEVSRRFWPAFRYGSLVCGVVLALGMLIPYERRVPLNLVQITSPEDLVSTPRIQAQAVGSALGLDGLRTGREVHLMLGNPGAARPTLAARVERIDQPEISLSRRLVLSFPSAAISRSDLAGFRDGTLVVRTTLAEALFRRWRR